MPRGCPTLWRSLARSLGRCLAHLQGVLVLVGYHIVAVMRGSLDADNENGGCLCSRMSPGTDLGTGLCTSILNLFLFHRR